MARLVRKARDRPARLVPRRPRACLYKARERFFKVSKLARQASSYPASLPSIPISSGISKPHLNPVQPYT